MSSRKILRRPHLRDISGTNHKMMKNLEILGKTSCFCKLRPEKASRKVSGKVPGRFREGSGKVPGRFREDSGKICKKA